jgi:hypothetical protein
MSKFSKRFSGKIQRMGKEGISGLEIRRNSASKKNPKDFG